MTSISWSVDRSLNWWYGNQWRVFQGRKLESSILPPPISPLYQNQIGTNTSPNVMTKDCQSARSFTSLEDLCMLMLLTSYFTVSVLVFYWCLIKTSKISHTTACSSKCIGNIGNVHHNCLQEFVGYKTFELQMVWLAAVNFFPLFPYPFIVSVFFNLVAKHLITGIQILFSFCFWYKSGCFMKSSKYSLLRNCHYV